MDNPETLAILDTSHSTNTNKTKNTTQKTIIMRKTPRKKG